jgi:alcohol dehydrogenase YqhD (iron-dependent ADH family)
MPTRLSDYGILGEDVRKVVERFRGRGTVLGENKDIDAEKVAEILRLGL